ncbi:hypothetical protein GE061_003715 [Apolygus lucorum]|uniref:BTB domain-containing protein n=1 Tax=Apolygus lucorum TaxID=248454 RepID=A0A8S9X2U7_APOLU|nr:hypothetical protein GE061_003715 [Apolygus lucorum]
MWNLCAHLLDSSEQIVLGFQGKSTLEFVWALSESDLLRTDDIFPISSPVYRTYNRSEEKLWYLQLYPHGPNGDTDFIGLYLCYLGSTNPKDIIQRTGTRVQYELFHPWIYESGEYSTGLQSQIIHGCTGNEFFQVRDAVVDVDRQHFFNANAKFGVRILIEKQYELYLLHHVTNKTSEGLKIDEFSHGKCVGLPDLVSRDVVLNSTNGYIFGDEIKFGVKIQTYEPDLALSEGSKFVLKDFIWDMKEDEVRHALSFRKVSPKFKTYNRSVEQVWQLEVYPHGDSEGYQRYLSIHLCYFGVDEVEVQYDVYLGHHENEQYTNGLTSEVFDYGKCVKHSDFIPSDVVWNATYGYLYGSSQTDIEIGLRIQTDTESLENQPTTVSMYNQSVLNETIPEMSGAQPQESQGTLTNGYRRPSTPESQENVIGIHTDAGASQDQPTTVSMTDQSVLNKTIPEMSEAPPQESQESSTNGYRRPSNPASQNNVLGIQTDAGAPQDQPTTVSMTDQSVLNKTIPEMSEAPPQESQESSTNGYRRPSNPASQNNVLGIQTDAGAPQDQPTTVSMTDQSVLNKTIPEMSEAPPQESQESSTNGYRRPSNPASQNNVLGIQTDAGAPQDQPTTVSMTDQSVLNKTIPEMSEAPPQESQETTTNGYSRPSNPASQNNVLGIQTDAGAPQDQPTTVSMTDQSVLNKTIPEMSEAPPQESQETATNGYRIPSNPASQNNVLGIQTDAGAPQDQPTTVSKYNQTVLNETIPEMSEAPPQESQETSTIGYTKPSNPVSQYNPNFEFKEFNWDMKDTSMEELVWEVAEKDILQLADKERIQSPAYRTHDFTLEQHWVLRLQVKPIWIGWDTQDFISLRLCYEGSTDSEDDVSVVGIKVQYELFLRNNESQEYSKNYSQFIYQCDGDDQFIEKNTVIDRKNGYIVNDKIMVGLRIQTISTQEDPETNVTESDESSLQFLSRVDSDEVVKASPQESQNTLIMKFVWDLSKEHILNLNNEDVILSSDFKTYNNSVEHLWNMAVTLEWNQEEDENYISLSLCYGGENEVEKQYELYVTNHLHQEQEHSLQTALFSGESPCHGLEDFLKQKSVLNSTEGYLIDDNIKFGLRIKSDPVPLQQREEPVLSMFFVWEPNHSELQRRRIGEWIYSPEFVTYDHSKERKWKLKIQPSESPTEHGNFQSLELCYEGGTVETQFALYSTSGNLNYQPITGFDTALFEGLDGEHCWGYDEIDVQNNTIGNDLKFGVQIRSDPIPIREPNDYFKIFVWDVNETDILNKRNQERTVLSEFRTYNNSEEQLWQLILYPHGDAQETDDYFSFSLCFLSQGVTLTHYEVYLVNNRFDKSSTGLSSKVFHSEDCMRHSEFILRETIENRTNGYWFDGNVKVGVRIRSDTDPQHPPDYVFEDFVWDVNVTELHNKLNEEVLLLPQFETHNHLVTHVWHVEIYPRGKIPEIQDFVHIALCYQGSSEVRKMYELYLLNQVSSKYTEGIRTSIFNYKTCARFPNFITRNVLLNQTNGFWFGDNIKVGLRIQTERPVSNNQSATPGELSNSLYQYWLKKRFTDVKLLSVSGEWVAHKVILASRSSVFDKILKNSTGNQPVDSIKISSDQCADVKSLLEFMYVGSVSNIHRVIADLIPCADNFNITGLKSYCEDHLKQNLSCDNLLERLVLLNRYDLPRLKDTVVEYISSKDRKCKYLDLIEITVSKNWDTIREPPLFSPPVKLK